jgi:integrase
MAKNLTAKAVDAVSAGMSRREIPDGLLTGLYLVVQPSGAKSWAIRYRCGGKPRKMTLGPVAPKLDGREPTPILGAPLTLAGARTVAREQLQIVAAGRDPATEHIATKRAARDPAAADRDLFGTLAKTFIKRYARPKNKSWRETARLLGLRPDDDGDLVTIEGGLANPNRWGKRKVQDISRREIIDLLDGIVDRGAPVAANATLAALRKMFNWAVERGTIDTSPAAGVKPPSSVKSRDRVLSDDELSAVWRTAKATPYPFGPAIRLLILTCARREEINALRRSEIYGDTIRLAGNRTKNGEPHGVPLSTEALCILDTLPRIGKNGLTFTTTGETPVSGWAKAKRILDDASGVHDWRMHDLRRTAATGLQRLGFRLEVIESALGHIGGSRAGIVGIYQRHSFEPEKREALEAWGRYVTLLGRPRTWSKVQAYLDAGDVAEGERQAVRRERDREFCRLITAGGATWPRYVAGIARRGDADNVVALAVTK